MWGSPFSHQVSPCRRCPGSTGILRELLLCWLGKCACVSRFSGVACSPDSHVYLCVRNAQCRDDGVSGLHLSFSLSLCCSQRPATFYRKPCDCQVLRGQHWGSSSGPCDCWPVTGELYSQLRLFTIGESCHTAFVSG